MNRKLLVGLISAAIAISFLFQNCGNGFEAQEFDEVLQLSSDNFIHNVTLNLDNTGTRYIFRLIQTEFTVDQENYELRAYEIGESTPRFTLSDPIFHDYTRVTPFAVQPILNNGDYKLVFFMSNVRNSLLVIEVTETEMSILWEEDLLNPMNDSQISNGLWYSKRDDSISVILFNHIIRNAQTGTPIISRCDLNNNHIDVDQCLPNVITCTINNGQGQQIWNGLTYGTCANVVCDGGHHFFGGTCEPDTIACNITNGTGTQDWEGSAYGQCRPVTCNSGYHEENNLCLSDIRTCPYLNGVGQQVWNGTDYDACDLVSCNNGYHPEQWICASDTRACSTTNGTGFQTWNGSGYNSCILETCNAGYNLQNNQCVPDTRSCNIANGTGQQTWNGSSWGVCRAQSCNTYYLMNVQGTACNADLRGNESYTIRITSGPINLNTICNGSPNPHMKPMNCYSGEKRQPANSGAAVTYPFGTWGSHLTNNAIYVVNRNGTLFCYAGGQKRDNDGTDRLVGIRCSNVATGTLVLQ